jgi:hypothetical protein
VQQLAAMLATIGSQSQPTHGQSSLSSQDQRKLDVLMLILEDAEKATTPEDRAKAFREYLEKSGDFAAAHPEQTNIWVMRAFAAVDVDEPKLGWEAGKKLQALGADNSENPKMRRVMASLDRKGWLGATPPADQREISAAINSVIDSINERLQDCPIGIWKQANVSLVVAGQYKLFPSDGKLEFRVEIHRPGEAPSTQILSVALSDLTPDSVQFAENLQALKEIVKNLQAFNAIVIGKGNQTSKVTSAKVRSGQTLEVETGEFVVVLPPNAARASEVYNFLTGAIAKLVELSNKSASGAPNGSIVRDSAVAASGPDNSGSADLNQQSKIDRELSEKLDFLKTAVSQNASFKVIGKNLCSQSEVSLTYDGTIVTLKVNWSYSNPDGTPVADGEGTMGNSFHLEDQDEKVSVTFLNGHNNARHVDC